MMPFRARQLEALLAAHPPLVQWQAGPVQRRLVDLVKSRGDKDARWLPKHSFSGFHLRQVRGAQTARPISLSLIPQQLPTVQSSIKLNPQASASCPLPLFHFSSVSLGCSRSRRGEIGIGRYSRRRGVVGVGRVQSELKGYSQRRRLV